MTTDYHSVGSCAGFSRACRLATMGAVWVLILATSSYAQMPRIRYTVEVNDPTSRTFHIAMQIQSRAGVLRLSMPASTPGEIDIKNHARYLLHFNAQDERGQSLQSHRLDK